MKKLIPGFIFFILLAGCSAKPYVIDSPVDYTASGNLDIYVISHGWHTGIIIPAIKIQQLIPELEQRFGEIAYLEFGWGDKGFYQAQEITSGLTLRAVFWPTESVMHVAAVPYMPQDYFPESKLEMLCLTADELSLLGRFIANSFYRDQQGKLVLLKNGLYGNSQFYKAEGDYYLMNTCNKWTAKALKSTGMDIWPAFKLSAGSIMDYLASHKASQNLTDQAVSEIYSNNAGQCP